MLRGEPLIFNQGAEVPIRRLFRVFLPYFMPERPALYIDYINLVRRKAIA
ncbi:MAG: hypothetical protein P5702_24870 [Limnospira sp. PMC 1291.21]|nr:MULTISPECIES: hypothetical protein [Limnospira]MDT9180782.1 hypothetical protein [Limnospira sp. PMC 1238.20]MDT9201246.1 hypothetical protein [Limnospira sp. PMC 1042.18]MDT9236908.1 hypothetical protein [Limnospira sp. PMC 917.15]MDT9242037.1 hypothetical protein [Limnospira sp. PMC 1261.20]MDT9257362.1 hypothetical protein [Limnospira sp. PMC 1254.20]MDT9293086.1 hypothetical protein [Limnospira sp. PMC 1295.21]MDT9298400.1 hypothetical protein [Arthrospira platensis PCC 7345]MDT93186